MTSGQDPVPPPDHARAETYLRLLAEAELRRIEALPRPDPLAEIGVPAPLRGPIRLALPLGQRAFTALRPLALNAVRALQPLAENAAQVLQPLAEEAARTIRPLAEDAARTLQPLAGTTAQTIQPITSQLAGRVLPAAEQTARRLHPLVWRAASRLPVATPLGSTSRPPERAEFSAVRGVRRLGAVAEALAVVGAVDHGTADGIMRSLETALVARSRFPPHLPWVLARRGWRQQQPGRPPAGTYLAAPVGALAVSEFDSGSQHAHLVTIVIAPDRALLTLAGWVAAPEDRSVHRDPWPVFGRPGTAAARDDRGNSYTLREDSGWSSGDEWNSTVRLSPLPPAGIRWLELTMSPGSAPIRVDLAGASASGAATAAPPPGGSAAERLIEAVATDLLYAATGAGNDDSPHHDLSQAADIVAALEAVGAVEPARDAVGRLITLAGRLGVPVPPALGAAAGPRDLPAAWVSVLENSRLDGPRGMTPAAAVLPELDGARFVLAGLRSDPAGAKLFALVWGRHGMFSRPPYAVISPWSWSARDNQGRWHVMGRGAYSGSADHAELELHLKPPLHPQATSLDVTLTGPSGQVTATVPLDWRQP